MSKATSLPTARGQHDQAGISWAWMGVALFAHTAWGAYPVLARYLQTVSGLPSMALLALGNLIALAVFAPLVIKRMERRFLRSPAIWGFTLVVVLRAITNVLSARFTLAIYVQLITLMTPLVVALLSAALFREKLPPYTWPAIGVSLLGSLLMMSGDIGGHGFSLALSGGDLLGIGLAVISMLSLSLYMILVPRTVKAAVPGEAVLLVQLVALTATSGALSLLIGEDWSRYLTLAPSDWGAFFAFVIFVLLGANLGQIAALRHLGCCSASSSPLSGKPWAP
jgi:drug/metabolite transporter (DMT)-like permease